jgi:hypothetical protein
MATLYRNPSLASPAVQAPPAGASGPVAIDTRIPPKARPVFSAVSVNGAPIPEREILAEAQHHPAARGFCRTRRGTRPDGARRRITPRSAR